MKTKKKVITSSDVLFSLFRRLEIYISAHVSAGEGGADPAESPPSRERPCIAFSFDIGCFLLNKYCNLYSYKYWYFKFFLCSESGRIGKFRLVRYIIDPIPCGCDKDHYIHLTFTSSAFLFSEILNF